MTPDEALDVARNAREHTGDTLRQARARLDLPDRQTLPVPPADASQARARISAELQRRDVRERGGRQHTYGFHVEVPATDRVTAHTALVSAVSQWHTTRHARVSEYTAGLVAAIEERGELRALRALLDDFSALDDPYIAVDDAADVLSGIREHVTARIAELEQAGS